MVAAALAALSCTREESAAPVGGSISISLGVRPIGTRATSPGDGSPADGGGIFISAGLPDLVILIADPAGDIVARYPESGSLQADPTTTAMAVSFTGLDEGVHTVYAFANTGGANPWAMSADFADLLTADDVEALQFSPLPADTCPDAADRLPLSARGSVSVSSGGTGEVSLQMIRCVAKVTIDFVNRTGAALTLDDFAFSLENLCPDRGYVCPRALPDLPSGISYGDIVHPEEDGIALGTGEVQSYSFYVFPGVAVPRSRDYLLNVGFTANGSAEPNSYSDLPVHDDHAVNIVSLERNQHLHIVTRISRGLTVSFNFEVADWIANTESVLFR